MKIIKVSLSLVLMVLLCFGNISYVAAQAEITVSPSGTADYTTIQDALDNAVAGDTIVVYPGTYNEQLTISVENLTIRSFSNPQDTIITWNGNVIQIEAEGVVLMGLTIDGQDACCSNAVWIKVSTATVSQCVLHNSDTGIRINAVSDGGHIIISENTFTSCKEEAIIFADYIHSSQITILNNQFIDLPHYAITFDWVDINLSEVLIRGNIISCETAGIYLMAYIGNDDQGYSDILIDNNQVSGSQTGIDIYDLYRGSISITNNTIHNCGNGIYMDELGYDEEETQILISGNIITVNDQCLKDPVYGIYMCCVEAVTTITNNLIQGTAAKPITYGIYGSDLGCCGAEPLKLYITDNTVRYTGYAIYLDDAPCCMDGIFEIANNILANNTYGLYIYDMSSSYRADYNIHNNIFQDNQYGIYCESGLYHPNSEDLTGSEVTTLILISSNSFASCERGIYFAEVIRDFEENSPLMVIIANDFYDVITSINIQDISDSKAVVAVLNNFHNLPDTISAPDLLHCIFNWWGTEYPALVTYEPWLVHQWLAYEHTEIHPIHSESGEYPVTFTSGAKLIFSLTAAIEDGLVAATLLNTSEHAAPGELQGAGIYLLLNYSSNLMGLPVRISVPVSDVQAEGFQSGSLKLYRFNSETNQWDELSTGYDSATKTVWAEVTGFSLFGVFGTPIAELPVTGSGNNILLGLLALLFAAAGLTVLGYNRRAHRQ